VRGLVPVLDDKKFSASCFGQEFKLSY